MARVKYVMLLPLTYNDKSKVPKQVRDQIEDEIFLLVGVTATVRLEEERTG